MSFERMPPDYDAWRTDPEWDARTEPDERDDYDTYNDKLETKDLD